MATNVVPPALKTPDSCEFVPTCATTLWVDSLEAASLKCSKVKVHFWQDTFKLLKQHFVCQIILTHNSSMGNILLISFYRWRLRVVPSVAKSHTIRLVWVFSWCLLYHFICDLRSTLHFSGTFSSLHFSTHNPTNSIWQNNFLLLLSKDFVRLNLVVGLSSLESYIRKMQMQNAEICSCKAP